MTDSFKDCRQRPVFIHSRLDDIPLSMEAFRVYCHLARRANECSQAWPSYRSIGEKCFRGSYPDSKPDSLRRKAIDAVKELISWNLLSVQPRTAGNGSQTSNLYCLTDDSDWNKSPTTPSPNARKSRAYQPRHQSRGVVMGEHHPGDGGSLGSDGGSPKVYPYEVNPIEVTPRTKERAREEVEIQISERQNSSQDKNSKEEKKPDQKKAVKQTKSARTSLNNDEAIEITGDRPTTPVPPWQQSDIPDNYHSGFLDYLVSTYLPTVGKWRDLSVIPTLGDAKNWIHLREKSDKYAQIHNKWDDYQQKQRPPSPIPYIPPVPKPDIPITEETLKAKAKAREYLESLKLL